MIEVTSFLWPITITHGLSVLGQACQHHYDNASLLPYHLKIKNRLLITQYLSILPKTPFLLRWILEDEKNCKEVHTEINILLFYRFIEGNIFVLISINHHIKVYINGTEKLTYHMYVYFLIYQSDFYCITWMTFSASIKTHLKA